MVERPAFFSDFTHFGDPHIRTVRHPGSVCLAFSVPSRGACQTYSEEPTVDVDDMHLCGGFVVDKETGSTSSRTYARDVNVQTRHVKYR